MDSITGMSVDSCESTIKFGRKLVRGQFLWVTFNVALLLFDWQTFNSSPSHMTAWAFGAMAVTVLWSLFFLLESWSEYRGDKQRLRLLNELHEKQMASGERQQYMNAKFYYEQMKESLEKNNVRPSEPSAAL